MSGNVNAQTLTTFSDWRKQVNVIVKEFDQSNGLPVISVSDLIIGEDGYIYIASSSGVSRFNGERFDLISSNKFPQLRSDRIEHLFAAADSSIWLIDEQGFFNRWKKGKLQTFSDLNDDISRPEWILRVSKTATAWVRNNYSLKYFKEEHGFSESIETSNGKIIDFLPVHSNLVFYLTSKGLYSFDVEKYQEKLVIPVHQIPFDITGTGLWETNLQEIAGGRIVLYNATHLMIYDINSTNKRIFKLPTEITTTPVSLLEVNYSQLLLHTYNGHFDLDLETGEFKKYKATSTLEVDQLTYNTNWLGNRLYIAKCTVDYAGEVIYTCGDNSRITEAVQDQEDNLWLSVAGKGIVRISISLIKILNNENGLKGENIYSIVEDTNADIWLASYETGIHKISNKRIDFWKGHSTELNNILMRGIYEKNDGTMVAASWDGGLYTYSNRENLWKPFLINDSLILVQSEAFLEDDERNFWIGTRKGLYRSLSGSNRFETVYTNSGIPILRVQVMEQTSDGTIWFGTHGGGLFVTAKGIQKVDFSGLQGELSIRDIKSESDSVLWIATEKKGLIKASINENKTIEHYQVLDQKDGLSSSGIHRIIEDDFGFLWLSSNQGIYRISKNELDDYLDHNKSTSLWIQQLTEDDGLPNREANGGINSSGIKTKNGEIWFPTQKGVAIIEPGLFFDKNPYKTTEIFISEITTPDSTYLGFAETEFKLESGSRSFRINFDLLHFTNPETIELEYQIEGEGVTNHWQTLADSRELTISNISPGTHFINIRISGVPNYIHEGAVFKLDIPYFFYEKNWFKVLIMMGVLAVFMFLLYINVHRAKIREEELNRKVFERTQSLHQQKIQTEQALKTIQEQSKQLERLNETKTDFFINIMHELRTPLSLIKGPLEMLKSASNTKNIDQDLQLLLIERNSNYLNEMVDRLLNLMRMEIGEFMGEAEIFNLSEFAKHQFSQFQSSIDLEDKEFVYKELTNAAYIRASVLSVEAILNNLISNSIKYTRPGDHIEVIVDKKDNTCMLEVRDTGIGIEKDELNFVFDIFYRAKNHGSASGSGIGLSVVKKIMNQLNGKVLITSEVNKGTSVRLVFPSAGNKALSSKSLETYSTKSFNHTHHESLDDKRTEITESHITQHSDKPHILIVDDNEDLRLFLISLLKDRYQVFACEDAISALTFLHQNSVDLIVSDLMMPEISGIEMTRKIRETESLKKIPIVFLSAKETEQSITGALSAGAQVYLTKPIQNRILIAQIEALLSREKRIEHQTKPTTLQDAFFAEVNELILRHLSDSTLNIDSIAEVLHMSRSTLYRKWKKCSPISLNDYIIETRLKEAIRIIQTKDYTFAEASAVCGFSEPAYFSQVFKKVYGCTPSEYFRE